MKRSILILVLNFILLISCDSGKKSTKEIFLHNLNIKYLERKAFFGDELTNYLPKEITSKSINFTETISADMGALELIVIDSISKDSIDYYQKKYERISKKIYLPSDTCLLVIDRFRNKKKHYNTKEDYYFSPLIERDCYNDKLPVPNFWRNDYTTDSTDCRLPKDFTLYIIEAKKGIMMKDIELTDGWFMPDNWKNGYSKGVALSTKRRIAIYWLNVW
jgi:hypothetical protein